MRPEFFGLVRQYIDAWNRHDVTTLDIFYDDTVVQESPLGALQGKDAVMTRWQALLHTFPDLSMDCRHQFAAGSHGVLEWTIKGTQQGHLETPWGGIPAAGKSVEFTGILSWEMGERGHIIRERFYFDIAGLLAQLGAMKIAVPA